MKDPLVGRDRWARRESLMTSRIPQVGAVIPNRPLSARAHSERAVKDNGPYLTLPLTFTFPLTSCPC